MSHRNTFYINPLPSISFDVNELKAARKSFALWRTFAIVMVVAFVVAVIATSANMIASIAVALLFAAILVVVSVSQDRKREYLQMKAEADYVTTHYDAVKTFPQIIEREGYVVRVDRLESDEQLLLKVIPDNPMYRQHEYLVTPDTIKVILGPRLDVLLDNLKLVALTDDLIAADAALQLSFEYRRITAADGEHIKAMRLQGD